MSAYRTESTRSMHGQSQAAASDMSLISSRSQTRSLRSIKSLLLASSCLKEGAAQREFLRADCVWPTRVTSRRDHGAHCAQDRGGYLYAFPGDMRIGVATTKQGRRARESILRVRFSSEMKCARCADESAGESDETSVTGWMTGHELC